MTQPPEKSQDSSAKLTVTQWLAACALAVMCIIAFANVLGRFLFHASIAFTEEITIHLFVIMVVLGIAVAFTQSRHLGMDSLVRRLPPSFRKPLTILHALLATALFLMVGLVLASTVYHEMTLFQTRSPSLGIPIWIYQLVALLAMMTIFYGIWKGIRKQNRQD